MARVDTVSLIDAVTADLRRRILAGELAPGAAVGEVDLAGQYEVARPTAKAAIEALVSERLLERRAHRTARVVALRPDDARDIYRAREALEAHVLRHLASTRHVPSGSREANAEIARLGEASPRDVVDPDMRFHRALVDAYGSDRTSRAYAALASEIVLCMAHVQGASLLSTEQIAAEHEELLRLVESGHGDGAAELLSVHLGRARERLVARLGGEPGPEAELELPL